MTLLAAFDVLLSRYSGQQDVVVGTPIAGRNRAEVEKLIGFFVNTLVMRTDLSGDPSFRELLARVRETAMGAYAHQDLPFEKLVEELKPERDLSRNPLFQVMLVLQNLPTASQKLGDIDATPFGAGAPNAKFDLTLIASEVTGWPARIDCLQHGLVRRARRSSACCGHFQSLLEAVRGNPRQAVSQLPLLRCTGTRTTFWWSLTRRLRTDPQDVVLHDFVARQAGQHPGCGRASVWPGAACPTAN